MKTYNAEELALVLDKHRKWLFGQEGGARADLSGADLSDAVLRRADLSGADLSGAVLRRADLRRADLSGADLRRADLRRAVLSDADLSGADLRRAVLSDAVLSGAVLSGAVLSDAVLSGAVLSGADLRRAVLSGADLRRAVLSDATAMPDGYLFGAYKSDVVPPLLIAGGKSFAEVVRPDVWSCNSWSNCPMHVAFDANSEHEIPPLYRAQGSLFIKLFDGGHLPMAMVRENCEAWEARHGRPAPQWVDGVVVCEGEA